MKGAADRIRARFRHAAVDLDEAALERLLAYFDLLAFWNRTVNLTAFALDDPTDQAIDRLLIEPLLAAPVVPDAPIAWCDLGSGGGSPALPIKVLKSRARLTMVEARSRKVAFLREAARRLEMADVSVIHDRFEQIATGEAFDLVTARAVRADPVFFTTVQRLLKPGGELLLFESTGSTLSPPPGFRTRLRRRLMPAGATELIGFERETEG